MLTIFILLLFLPSFLLTQSAHIPTAARFTRPGDLRAVWLLHDSTTSCPKNITHTAFTNPETDTFILRHDTIIQDNVRCSTPLEDHVVTFRPRQAFESDLSPRSGPPLPAETLRQLRGDTVAKRALDAGDRAGENFLLGYEVRVRQCGGLASFEDGTAIFVFRPFTDRLRMDGVEGALGKGLKWMVVAPREGGLCVYDSDVDGPDDGGRGNTGSDDPDDPDDPDDGNNSESAGEDDDGERACFPANANVRTMTRGIVKISEVRVGEFVSGGKGSWTRVIGFSHRDRIAKVNMVEISAESGVRVRASDGHYMYTSRGLTSAGYVTTRDWVRLENGTMDKVSSVNRVADTGLINLQTVSGDVVVNGIWASTYTTAVRTEIAHAALSPLRALMKLVDIKVSFETDFVLSAVEGAGLWRFGGTKIVS